MFQIFWVYFYYCRLCHDLTPHASSLDTLVTILTRILTYADALLLRRHHTLRGKLLSYGRINEASANRLKCNLLVFAPEITINWWRLAYEHPHFFVCCGAEPARLTLVHYSVVHIISFHNIEVVPAFERRRLLLEVTVGRMRPPQLARRLLAQWFLAGWAVCVRVDRVNNEAVAAIGVLFRLYIEQSAMLIVQVLVLLQIWLVLNVPLAEELVQLQCLDYGVLGTSFIVEIKVQPRRYDEDD